MRILLVALLAALSGLAFAMPEARSQDAFDFGDPLPLPPPPLDDSPPPPSTAVVPAPPPAVTPEAPPLMLPPAADEVTNVSIPPLTDALPPPAQPPTPVAAETPASPEDPKPARIAGGRVNVRAGPNTQYESVAVLTTGTPVTVVSKHGEWYKVVFPADQLASIHKNFVTAEITGDIPEAGTPGVVNQDAADVHAYYWDRSTVVGRMNKGDPVTIRQERGQWYRIDAPPSARAYIFAEYVRIDGNAAVPIDIAPPPENPAVDLTAGKEDGTGRPRLTKADQDALKIKEAYFSRLREQARRDEEQEARRINELEQALDDLAARLSAVDLETAGMLSYPVQTTAVGGSEWAPPDPMYGGFTGWIENIGRVGGAPASFRLSKGGEVRFYLRSDRYNLNDFIGRRVWVNGNVELAAGANANVLNVDQLRVLTDAEIARGMATGQPQAAPPLAAYPEEGYPGQGSDPYAAYGTPSAPPGTWEPAPATPSQLPDVVGGSYAPPPPGSGAYPAPMSQPSPAPGLYPSSQGEVATDYYENPFISEIGP